MLQGPVRSQVRLNRIPGSEEGVGGFGAEPGQVPQSSGKKKSERSGGKAKFKSGIPKKVPEKVSGGFGAEPGQVQQGVGGFGAEPGQVHQGSGEGLGSFGER